MNTVETLNYYLALTRQRCPNILACISFESTTVFGSIVSCLIFCLYSRLTYVGVFPLCPRSSVVLNFAYKISCLLTISLMCAGSCRSDAASICKSFYFYIPHERLRPGGHPHCIFLSTPSPAPLQRSCVESNDKDFSKDRSYGTAQIF